MNGSREFPASTDQGPVRSEMLPGGCASRDSGNRTGPNAGPARPGSKPKRLRGLAGAVLLAFAALLVLPGQTAAQSERSLLDSTHSDFNKHHDSGQISQRFTTGPSPHGYTLSQVWIHYEDADGDGFSLEVCTVTGADQPTDTCTDFTAPVTFPEVPLGDFVTADFTHTTGMQLAADTKYAVVLTPESGKTVSYAASAVDGLLNEDDVCQCAPAGALRASSVS